MWNYGTLFNALWTYATYDTREMISSIERAAYPTRTCVYTRNYQVLIEITFRTRCPSYLIYRLR